MGASYNGSTAVSKTASRGPIPRGPALNMKRVIIIHGWEGKPASNWFPWLKGELEARGIVVLVPEMPETAHPRESEWVPYLAKTVGTPDENTFLIGHSLGGITILRYLESLPEGTRIGGAVLVAAFSEALPNRKAFAELSSFFACPVDFERTRRAAARQFVAIQSDNDRYVPMLHGEIFKDKLGAKLITVKGGGHLNAGDGYLEFPEALAALDALMV